MTSRSPFTKSAASSPCSSRTSGSRSDGPGMGAPARRTRTMAGWALSPRNPWRGSCRISICASCSVTPSSSRAASMASSTLAALLSTSSIRTSSARATPATRIIRRTRSPLLLAVPRFGFRPPGDRPRLSLLGGPDASRAARALGPLGRPVTARLGRALPLHTRQHEVLLADLDQVRRGPVDHQPGREDQAPEAEKKRHEFRQGLLLLAALRSGFLHLPLLVIGRCDHPKREYVVGEPRGRALPTIEDQAAGIRDVIALGIHLHLLAGLRRVAE